VDAVSSFLSSSTWANSASENITGWNWKQKCQSSILYYFLSKIYCNFTYVIFIVAGFICHRNLRLCSFYFYFYCSFRSNTSLLLCCFLECGSDFG
jgi:hypothetical protein